MEELQNNYYNSTIDVLVDPVLKDIIPDFLDMVNDDLENMKKGLSDEDFNSLMMIGHSLKGSGGGYGFDEITKIGDVIERSAKLCSLPEIDEQVKKLDEYLNRVNIVYK
jgi:HPt (histidine-containing phosphotransfer) domain-containing protein